MRENWLLSLIWNRGRKNTNGFLRSVLSSQFFVQHHAHSCFGRLVKCWAASMENVCQVTTYNVEVKNASNLFCSVLYGLIPVFNGCLRLQRVLACITVSPWPFQRLFGPYVQISEFSIQLFWSLGEI